MRRNQRLVAPIMVDAEVAEDKGGVVVIIIAITVSAHLVIVVGIGSGKWWVELGGCWAEQSNEVDSGRGFGLGYRSRSSTVVLVRSRVQRVF